MNERNVAASVRAKLLNKARAEKRDFTQVLTRYALERLLYRLSISTHANHFLLKGALLFDLWFDVPLRPGSGSIRATPLWRKSSKPLSVLGWPTAG